MPGIGDFSVHYDRLRLVSTVSPSTLRQVLIEAGFGDLVHNFEVKPLEKQSGHYRSKLEFTPLAEGTALELLHENEVVLGTYNFTIVEVACDCHAATIAMLRERTIRLVKMIAKPRAVRGHVVAARRGARQRWKAPDPSRPTFYVEDRASTVGLKFYERFGKRADGRMSRDMLTRMELTFKRSQTIRNKLGGDRVADLLKADLPDMVRQQLRLERVDYVQLGKLLATKTPKHRRVVQMPVQRSYASMDDYLATRRAVTMLRWHAAKNTGRLNGWEDALLLSLHSPIEIVGILKKLRRRNPAITEYKIRKCFIRMPWRRRVRL